MSHIVNQNELPTDFPTQYLPPKFCEALGRAVASFGFLEEVLRKAIFALTATKRYSETEIESAYEKWLPKLEHALTAPLGGLIDSYSKALRESDDAAFNSSSDLIALLRKASVWRNVICHASWQRPDETGASVPRFVRSNDMQIFDMALNEEDLIKLRRHVAGLAGSVVSSVTALGFQFPGSNGPGKPI